MKKSSRIDKDELRTEYKRFRLPRGDWCVANTQRGSASQPILFVLRPEVAEVFPN